MQVFHCFYKFLLEAYFNYCKRASVLDTEKEERVFELAIVVSLLAVVHEKDAECNH
jgi:hypothetical protein